MAIIRALFWDIGGVLLNNAWDHEERDLAIQRFELDKPDFEARHKKVLVPFEEGSLSLDDYLKETVFYRPRPFTRDEFKQFMFSLSRPKPETIEIARSLSAKYQMATINNESRELNQYRIQTFKLTELFDLFISSCFVGVRKPEARIYRMALDVTQHVADECCFIDDRPDNLEGAAKLGINTILMKDPAQLRRDLQRLGVAF
jgi:putative hydrolase of the HAD superfamily